MWTTLICVWCMALAYGAIVQKCFEKGEDPNVDIKCTGNRVIKLIEDRWGKNPNTNCSLPSTCPETISNMYAISVRCAGKTQCKFKVEVGWLDDPCKFHRKYFWMNYTCIEDPNQSGKGTTETIPKGSGWSLSLTTALFVNIIGWPLLALACICIVMNIQKKKKEKMRKEELRRRDTSSDDDPFNQSRRASSRSTHRKSKKRGGSTMGSLRMSGISDFSEDGSNIPSERSQRRRRNSD